MVRRQVEPRNPQRGTEMRCLTGVQRNRVVSAAQLRVTKEEPMDELATRLGMVSTGEEDLRRGTARVAGHARKRAVLRKRREVGERRLMMDNFGSDLNMWGSVKRRARKGRHDMHATPLEGKVPLNHAETLSMVSRDRS